MLSFVLFALLQSLPAGSMGPTSVPPLARVESVPLKAPTTPGASVTLEVTVTPREGIHVYAPPQKQYIPVSIAVEPPAGARVGKPQFPPSVVMTFVGEKVRVYDKPFTIRLPIVLPASGASAVVAGTVTYQACDDVMCYRPVKVPVRWEVRLQ
jgi:DsbC/DsbD-like thiol-disulfide interchange protein